MVEVKHTPSGEVSVRQPRPPAQTSIPDFTLSDKYTRQRGTILLSGIQALARLPLDQHRADRQRGLNTATFISGYRGSPLGGLDLELQREPELLREHQVEFMPGLNEDLAATAVYGSQIANLFPDPKFDGVLGMWYGKGPGVDRSGDAFKHANFAGAGKYGGVLALAGDDPNAKSSTIPSASEIALWDAYMPVVFPGTVQEILDLGRFGFELSRYSGLWVGFKIVTNVADEFSTADISPERVQVKLPLFEYRGKPWEAVQNPNLLTPFSLTTEREIYEGRLEAARRFGVANNLNPITLQTSDDWLGIMAPGKTYYDVRQVLDELGLDDDTLQRYGIRLMRVGLLAPLDFDHVRAFARGLEELLVIEEKRAFVETFVRDALYPLAERPRILGKHDDEEKPFVKPYGELDADDLVKLLAARISRKISDPNIAAKIARVERPDLPMTLPLLARRPYFCSGCPHNTSAIRVPEGSLAGAGIGCHTMTLLMDTKKTRTTGLTQMGGEGAQWVGASLFTDLPHIFQNLGDGTLFHSGSLAIRQAVAAKANITYKLLWNSAVAMTGGQDPEVSMPVWRLTHLLRAEGVGRIIVTTPTPDGYPPEADWARGVEVWHRDRFDEAQIALRDEPGVTLLIHDQECAAELRRKRRRGLIESPAQRIFINEAVCEGCGDCGEKSNCLSVFPVETEFGRKTQIHQSSCNLDFSCIKGHCPAFVAVTPGTKKEKKPLYVVDVPLPDPEPLTHRVANIFMTGIGGTGVVTANQILTVAAAIDGKRATGLDQTGLSQKGGPVVSHLKILDDRYDCANKISHGEADCYMVFDVLTGTDHRNLIRARRDKTVAVVSTSEVPTGEMVSNTGIDFPQANALHRAIDEVTRADLNVYFDAIGLSETLFGSHMPANTIVIGAAYQRGLIPVSAAAIERAIELNGVAWQMNVQAFRAGRRIVIDPAWAESIKAKRAGDLDYTQPVTPATAALIAQVG
ncbi:MAG TPA: indolepyruvate ferredoxin oxidoreductase family protein, partial [Aggregatilineales bacterium]|nr:indolepyruvate ferredoxin oxidoreductase family protein [Aggregatilineales bacterium]